MRFGLVLTAIILACSSAKTDEATKESTAKSAARTVEQLAADAKPSVVVILFTGRDGKQQGLGTGFVISADGLIATNNHVIGEARPIKVQTSDGTRYDVTSIHASDRNLDLALLKIDAKGLKPLALGDATKAKPGQAIVALGHPRGLEYSVVAGVLSGQRDLEGQSMLQIAMPIEQGNSGGPVLDMEGNVLGIVTMKSLVTANLGFAVAAAKLKPLLDRPNPIPMDRWLTIGQLDKSEWKTLYGSGWRQRAGRIIADGAGTGFGGRTLCLSQRPAPKLPYELAVTVRLNDEKGAAGLIFGGDGGDRHYGFYPSGGRMRLTKFNGPDVLSWKILKEFATPHYRPGDWNTLKVRLEKDKVLCHVNDELVADVVDPDLAGSVAGLAKFRDTVADFKRFQMGSTVATSKVPEKLVAELQKTLTGLKFDHVLEGKELDPLVKSSRESLAVLRDRARQLEKQAERLRKLAGTVHQESVLAELAKVFEADEAKVDLGRAALLLARLDNEELDVDAYVHEMDRLARDIRKGLAKDADEKARLAAINKFLFEERGFHGSRVDYYSRPNSYLNEVIDDREGLPITLSVLYLELARRLNVSVVGLGLPGQFVVRFEPAQGPAQVIDVYERGKLLSEKETSDRVLRMTGKPIEKKHLEPVSKKAIVVRMLHNLLNVAQHEEDRDGMQRYLDAILKLDAEAHEDRWIRAVLRFQAGERDSARHDVEYLLDHAGDKLDVNRVRELHRLLMR